MPYSQFKFSDLHQKFGIEEETTKMFENLVPVEPTDWLTRTLEINLQMPLLSEKSKSEYIIAPILTDIWEQNKECFTIFSGVSLDVDTDKGLNGECDFIFSSEPRKKYSLVSPIFTLVEAKNDNISNGIPQCIAQMLGARLFNEKNEKPLKSIYGCVTTGEEWQFLELNENKILVHNKLILLNKIDEILGALQYILNISLSKKCDNIGNI